MLIKCFKIFAFILQIIINICENILSKPLLG
jgi:hypothetical protein